MALLYRKTRYIFSKSNNHSAESIFVLLAVIKKSYTKRFEQAQRLARKYKNDYETLVASKGGQGPASSQQVTELTAKNTEMAAKLTETEKRAVEAEKQLQEATQRVAEANSKVSFAALFLQNFR